MDTASSSSLIEKAQAICLQIHPWSKTSHIVTWLTPGFGKVTTVVKGACRAKSAFLGQYDHAYTCELLFYRREREGVHAIRECWPVCMREPLRLSWRASSLAAYLCGLTARSTVGAQESGGVFRLLSTALDALAEEKPQDWLGFLLWYETHLLRLIGFMPDLTLCPICHTEEHPWFRFSLPSGRFVCEHQSGRGTERPDNMVQLHQGVRKLLIRMGNASAPFPIADPDSVRTGLIRFLGIFYRFHLDLPLSERNVMLELLQG